VNSKQNPERDDSTSTGPVFSVNSYGTMIRDPRPAKLIFVFQLSFYFCVRENENDSKYTYSSSPSYSPGKL
jgi:hypothetical protein